MFKALWKCRSGGNRRVASLTCVVFVPTGSNVALVLTLHLTAIKDKTVVGARYVSVVSALVF